jgi:hypothetical protein
MRMLERVDNPNDAPDLQDRVSSFVAIAIRARKPAGA